MNTTGQSETRNWLAAGVLVALSLGLTAVILGGCAAANETSAAPTPTKTQMPTFTPAPPTATATEVPPTATDAPLPTATPEPTALPTEAPPTPEPTPIPPAATPRPAAPRATPRPMEPTAVPQPVTADPCAGIGGDGCKWRVTGGPSFGENGGMELKLQLFFIHSGIDGGQPQPDYRVILFKDGQRVSGPENGRSIGLASSQGPLGKYNYEYSLGVDKLPGNTVAGSYYLYVQDGNSERDSRDIPFVVPTNSGLIWIQFDQN